MLSYQRGLKKNIKIGEFLCSILILKTEEDTQRFRGIILYYFKKSKNATEMQVKNLVQCMEKVL